jgi:ribonuclease J
MVEKRINKRSLGKFSSGFKKPVENKKQMNKKNEKVKLCFLGGMGEITKNMSFIEYKDQILIFDCGLKFPEENMPGVDFIIPNVNYLEKNKKKILGIFITHGHYDHIGAIPYVIERLGNPIIYTSPLTRAMILKRQEEFKRAPKLKVEEINLEKKEGIKIGRFVVYPFRVNHNIPDSMGIATETPEGTIFYIPDFKIDFNPVLDPPIDLGHIAKIASKNPLLLLADSTSVEKLGRSLSEVNIFNDLESIFEKAVGRVIVGTFASLISRIQQIIWISEKFGRKIVLEGYSMRNNVELARRLGYLKIQRGTLISSQESAGLLNRQITILCTGAQGEENAALMRIVNRIHRNIKIEKGDSVIFSSSIIPGHENSVQKLKDSFYQQGAEVYNYQMMDIHTGGHAHQEDLKILHNIIKPKFFIPVCGQYSMLKIHSDLAHKLGMPKENIKILSNGQVVELSKDEMKITGEEIIANDIMVDGLGVGDVNEVVLRDRNLLSKDGVLIIVSIVDGETGKIKGEPEIYAKGFVYSKGAKEKEFKKKIVEVVKDIISKTASKDRTANWFYVKDNLRDKVGDYIFRRTERRPIVLPFIVEV